MSLVNDMLNDLDSRRSDESGKEKIDVSNMIGNKPLQAKRAYLPLISAAFVMLMLAVAYALWQQQESVPVFSVKEITDRKNVPSTVMDTTEVATTKSTVKNTVKQNAVTERAVKERRAEESHAVIENNVVKNTVSVTARTEENSVDNTSAVYAPKSSGAVNLEKKDLDQEKITSKQEAKPDPIVVSVEETKSTKISSASSAATPAVRKVEAPVQVRSTTVVSLGQQDINAAKQAELLLRQGQIAQAESTVRQLLQSQPAAAHSGELLAGILMAKKQFSEAEYLLDQLTIAHGKTTPLKMVQARLWLETDRAGDAVDLLMEAKPSVAGNQPYYELLGLAARKNKQYSLSEQTYRGLIDIDNRRGDWWVGLAIALDAQGIAASARSAYINALKTGEISAPLQSYARQRLSAMGVSQNSGV